MNNKEKLKKHIENSNLELEEKALWYRYLEIGKDPDIDAILGAVEKNPEDLKFLTKNFKNKIEAFESGSEEDWKRIAQNDMKYVSEE